MTPYSRRILLGILLPAGAAVATSVALQADVTNELHWGWRLAVPVLAAIAVAIPIHRWIRAPLRALGEEAQDLVDRERRGAGDEIRRLRDSLTELSRRSQSQLQALEAERQHLLAIVSSMSEGVLVVDQDGRAVIRNPRWTELFGSPDDGDSAGSSELTRQAQLERLVKQTLETGVGDEEELELDTSDAKTIIATSSALSDRSGVVVVARDISEFLKLAEIRRDFVANVSHELKTPLSAIRGLSETLIEGALDDHEAAAGFVGRIISQCKRLEAILSDLLTLSRLEHPKAPSRRDPVDLGQAVKEAAEILAPRASARGIEIEMEIDETESLNGDYIAIERLALNLLENAIKYNRQGGRVAVRVRQRQNEVLLEVSDSGIGIPAESLNRLFERFYRVDKGRSREEGGTGLGLAIVKHATNLHHGRIDVDSRLGRGTTFRVYLPTSSALGEA